MTPETRQRLLELVYDLLPEPEAAELRQRIAAEPELAAAYAEAQATAKLLGEAARWPAPRVPLKRPQATEVQPAEAGTTKPERRPMSTPSTPARKPRRRPHARVSGNWAATWIVCPAAAALVLVALGGYFFHRWQLSTIAAEHLRLVVTGPPELHAGVAAEYAVKTTTVTGEPMPAQIELALYTADGKRLLDQKETTDEQGRLQVAIPADMVLPAGQSSRAVLKVNAVHGKTRQEVQTTLPVEPVRYATQLSLDKPLYQPGETVFYRSLTLSRFGMAADRDVPVHFEIRDPGGVVVPGSQYEGVTDRGVGNGAFPIPDELAGGQYTLIARSLDGAFPEEKRNFFVRRYRLPRLKKELEFARDSYGPGDAVAADFSAQRAEGGAAAGIQLRIIATVDGQTVFQKTTQADAAGRLRIEFTLPQKIERGDGQLAVVADDGGTKETQAKTIPINLGKVEVKFFAEGGDLVEGLENRVYFTGRNPLGKPVHIKGMVVDGHGNDIAIVETTHEGMGSFSFTPRSGEKYSLRITSPAPNLPSPTGRGAGGEGGAARREGSDRTGGSLPPAIALPPAVTDHKIVLSTGTGVFEPGTPLEFNIRAAKPGIPLVLAASCRGVPVGQQALVTEGDKDKPGLNPVSIPLDDQVEGVVRVTVYDYSTSPPKPIAERLVYRRPARKLVVRAADHSERYAPGERVNMSLVVTNEKGEPVPATLGVAVVDDALLNLADDHTPGMNTHFLLTSEIEKPEDLEKADFYLSEGKDATVALDLLLGTQGWRRFVEKTLEEYASDTFRSARFSGLAGGKPPEGGTTKQPPKGGTTNAKPPEGGTPTREELARLVALGGSVQPPAMFDNLGELRAKYEQDLGEYRARRNRALNTLVTLSFFGGLGLALLVAILGLLKIAGGLRFWLPLAGAVASCVIVGTVLRDSTRLATSEGTAVAFAQVAAAPAAEVAGDKDRPRKPEEKPQDKHGADDDVLTLKQQNVIADLEAERIIAALENDNQALREGREDYADDARLFRGERGRVVRDDGKIDPAGIGVAVGPTRRLKVVARDGDQAGGKDLKDMWRGDGLDHGNGVIALVQYRFTVREYAHKHIAGPPGVRSDFAETLFWHPRLIAGADGRATISFELSDSVTAFRVLADAHGDGRIGSGRAEVISRIPFNLEPKLPLEVNAGDRIDLPLAIVNDSRNPLPVGLTLEHSKLLKLDGPRERKLELLPGQRTREYFNLSVVGVDGKRGQSPAAKGDSPLFPGECELVFRGQAGPLADAVRRPLRIVPPGFPRRLSMSGRIDGPQRVTVDLPDEWVPGSLAVTLTAFPSTLADLQKGLDGILQEPNGCFEQASSSNYPNVLSLQYMQEHDVADPAVTRRAKDLIKRGYARLTGYECKEKGYEWFGGDPGHEALTSYGLMEFRDMAAVYEVDPAMLRRTAEWLLARRDGKGGFQRNPRALDSFGGAPEEITNAYITWALAESGQKGIEAEVKHVIEVARKSDDPYLVALAGAAALSAGNAEDGRALLEKLAKSQADDGHLEGKQGSITRSGGLALQVETTALAAMAWLKQPSYTAQAQRAVEWIIKNRQGSGGFGSTQSTILALKALVQHAKTSRKTVAEGQLVIKRDSEVIGQRPFGAGQQEAIALAGLEASLKPGANQLTINLTGNNQMPFALDVSYRTRKPESDKNCPVRLSTSLASAKVKAGETVPLAVELSNTADHGLPMTVAILGLPAGLEARADQLEELKKAGTIDYYETRAREVICYWRSLAPKKKVGLKFDLVAAVPGSYIGPASRAYLYYTAEQKQWADPLAVEITRE